MSQVKRTRGQRATDLAQLLKMLCVHEDPTVVMAALQSVAAQVIFTNAGDHNHFQSADFHTYKIKQSLIELRSKVHS